MFNKFQSFRRAQDGNATIEFVFLFPLFMFLFLTGFEASYFMVRNVMLERAIDVAVRDVRMSNGVIPNSDELRKNICDQAAILPDCENQLQIEMQQVPISVNGIDVASGPVKCVNANDTDYTDSIGYDVGQQNALVVLNICALADPLFPTTGIGVGMQRFGTGKYAIVSTTAFVTEPGARTVSTANGGSS